MKRKIDQSNPFYDLPRFAFGFEHIRDGMRLLDYGCFDASFGRKLLAYRNVDYYGVDKNTDILKQIDPPLRVSAIRDKLPFEDGFFDVATIFEVLEHVHDQDAVLGELHRVLKPDGLLIASVPRKHVFTLLDKANFKFIFPGLHRIYYTFKYSKKAYSYRYLNNPNGLIGDIEKAKSWHQHFRDSELVSLLERNTFAAIEVDGAGLLSGLFEFLAIIAPPLRPLLANQRLLNWDSYRFGHRMLFCVARKESARPSGS